jgi:hypothetical protein
MLQPLGFEVYFIFKLRTPVSSVQLSLLFSHRTVVVRNIIIIVNSISTVIKITACQEGTPLHAAYSFSFMRRGKASKSDEGNASAHGDKPTEEKQEAATTTPHPYENSIKTISTVKTIEQFWSTYNYLKRPNDLSSTTDYHFFRDGIKPTWEDPKNAKGGKWIVSPKRKVLTTLRL